MCNSSIRTTWEILMDHIRDAKTINLIDVYKNIKEKQGCFLLAPNLTIYSLMEILESNGLASFSSNDSVTLTAQGKEKVKKVYQSVVY